MSNRTLRTAAMAFVVVILAGMTFVVIWWFAAGEGAPSAEVAAPTLEAAADTEGGQQVVYRIDKEQSEVRFSIYEELQGNPNTVVGVTQEVAADIVIDFDTPANSQLGTVVINARSLRTDNELRNRALRNQILFSGQDAYEFITFEPTGLLNIPGDAQPGTEFSFQVVGELTARGVTLSVTFDVTLTVTEAQVQGSATAVVLYRDFGIVIPSVPGVANVGDEVTLEIDFIALPADGDA